MLFLAAVEEDFLVALELLEEVDCDTDFGDAWGTGVADTFGFGSDSS